MAVSEAIAVLVDPDRRRVEVAELAGGAMTRRAYGSGETVPTPFAVIDLDAFYDALDAVATTT